MEPRINLITLGVADLARSKKFYCEGLGWKIAKASNEHILFIDCVGVILALFGRKSLADDIGLDEAQSGFRGVTLAQNVLSKEAVRNVLENAKRAGATLIKPAEDVFWGGYSGYFTDPDGHYWEIAWNPFFELDEEGKIRF